MKSNHLILVTAAAGKTGGATASALLQHTDMRVRAMVRIDDQRAQALRDAGAEVFVGNMNDIRDMRKAMHGVQRAYFVAPISGHSLDQALNFAIAAEEACLEHVVLLSQWLASPSHPSLLTRRTWLTDRMMTWIPNVTYTVINVGWFADNYMSMLGMAAQFGILTLPFKGITAPIDELDIGRVVAGVLRNPEPYVSRTLRPTGPEMLTGQQVADAFAEVLGRRVKLMLVPINMVSKTLRAMGLPPFQHAQSLRYIREYDRGTFELAAPSDVVQEVTGKPAENFTSILRRYAKSDPLAARSIGSTLSVLWLMLRTMAISPMNVKNWEAEQGLPGIDSAEYCNDSSEWSDTHSASNSFWVAE